MDGAPFISYMVNIGGLSFVLEFATILAWKKGGPGHRVMPYISSVFSRVLWDMMHASLV